MTEHLTDVQLSLLHRCKDAVSDLFEIEKAKRDEYVGYPTRWSRYNQRVIEVGELLADLRAAVTTGERRT